MNLTQRLTISGLLLSGAAGVWGYTQLSKVGVSVEPQPENLINESLAQQIVAIEDTGPEIETFSHIELIKTTEGVDARLTQLRDSNQALVERFIEENSDINWFNIWDSDNSKVNLLRTFIRRNTQQFIDTDIQSIYDSVLPHLDLSIGEIPTNLLSMNNEGLQINKRLLESRLREIDWFTNPTGSPQELFRRGLRSMDNPYLLTDNGVMLFRDFIKYNLPDEVSFNEVENLFGVYEENLFNEEWTGGNLLDERIRVIDEVNKIYLSKIGLGGVDEMSGFISAKVNARVHAHMKSKFNLSDEISVPSSNNYNGWLMWLYRDNISHEMANKYEEGSFERDNIQTLASRLATDIRFEERLQVLEELDGETMGELSEINENTREEFSNLISHTRELRDRIGINNPFGGRGIFTVDHRSAVIDINNDRRIKELNEKVQFIRDTILVINERQRSL